MKNKTIVTILGIRPDWIRMSQVIKKLDDNFNHILINTNQHYSELLSDVFFKDLNIRPANYNLNIGADGRKHYEQQAILGVKIIELLEKENIKPDTIIFLGDSNSVLAAIPLKKEGYHITHIESCMRSGDKRMAEEVNRICCDQCSDILFTYHENYKQKGLNENIPGEIINIVGNTICEPLELIKNKLIAEDNYWEFPDKKHILVDIHRPENFKYKERMERIIEMLNEFAVIYNLPVKMLEFPRTMQYIKDFNLDLGTIETVPLMGYIDFIKAQMESKFIVSDSGSASEEAPLLCVPVIVPRDFTERPECYENNNCIPFHLDIFASELDKTIQWLNKWNESDSHLEWLRDGLNPGETTSEKIVEILKEKL